MKIFLYSFLLASLLLAICMKIYPQEKTKNGNHKKDKDTSTIKNDFDEKEFRESLQKAEEMIINEMVSNNKEKQIKTLRVYLFNSIRNEAGKIKNYFEKGIDTTEINQELKTIENRYLIASEDILINDNNHQTTRNLKTSEILLDELVKAAETKKKLVNNYLKDVNSFRHNLDSLTNDTILFKFPKDTASLAEYFKNLINLSKDVEPIDSNLNKAIKNLNDINNNINTLLSRIYNSKNIIKNNRSAYESIIFGKELPYIWENFDKYKPYKEALSFSYKKNKQAFLAYSGVYFNMFYLTIILLLFVYIYVRKLRRKILVDIQLQQDPYYKIILKQPFLSSLFISLNVFQFVFPNPPVIFSGLIWLFASAILIVLLIYVQRKYFVWYWLYILIFYIFTFQSNLLLQISSFERWYLILLAIFASISGIIALKKQSKLFGTNTKLKIFSFLPLLLFLLSLITNISGRFNLTKTFLTVGVFMVVAAVLLFVTMKLLEKLIFLVTSNYENATGEKYIQNLKKLSFSLPRILKITTITGWIILVGRNFYFYDYITSGIQYFIEAEQTIGNFKFSFEGILLFLAIIISSTIISKIISLYSDSHSSKVRIDPVTGKKSGGLGNWLLLIRIALVTAGVLVAFAATGIPIDRLTIILGSLGVGIGFGMQTIVNNLMSGILLAFERPIQIGDQIEVEGKSGIIREIGIRSSKLETFEGSDVIIPNGDLLSRFVINWTRNNNQRRIELLINVKSGSDTEKCKKILETIINSNESVDKTPTPMVLLSKFSGSSIEFRILFWSDIFKAIELKSDILYEIQNEFKKERIELTT